MSNLDKNSIRLPIFLKPKFKTDLIRLGKNNDGGYSISKLALKDTSILYSFGLSDDWSFEKQFRKKFGAKIICFDPSVTPIFWFKRFIKDLIQLFLLKESIKNITNRFFTYFHYKFFFNNLEKMHVKFFFAPIGQSGVNTNNSDIIDMNTILQKWGSENYFIKIDIEGNEYRILDQIIKYQDQLTGLVIEFHNCDLMFEKIKLFIVKLNLDLVHIHVNNFGILTKEGFPTVLELTFSPKKYNSKRSENDNNFPKRSIDQPNNKIHEDIDIVFYE